MSLRSGKLPSLGSEDEFFDHETERSWELAKGVTPHVIPQSNRHRACCECAGFLRRLVLQLCLRRKAVAAGFAVIALLVSEVQKWLKVLKKSRKAKLHYRLDLKLIGSRFK